MVAAVLERQFGAEGPSDQPGGRKPSLAHEVHRRGDVERLGAAAVERALARATGRRRAARIEPEDGQIGELRKPARRLAEDPVTLEELSSEFDISRERVRQIEVRAFEKVQEAVQKYAAEQASAVRVIEDA